MARRRNDAKQNESDIRGTVFGHPPSAFVTHFGDVGDPRTFLTDFELAAIQAITSTFANCTLKGCSFHFRQAIYRRVQQEGLVAEYENDSSAVRRWIRQLLAMTA